MPLRSAHALALALVLAAKAASAQQPPKGEANKGEGPKTQADAPKAEAPKVDAPKGQAEPPKAEAPKAQGDAAKAAELKGRGDQAMDGRRYAEAVALYQGAIEANADPSLFYNLGRAYQAMGEYPDAFFWLGRFDREAPSALKARVPRLSELLTELRARITEVTIRANVNKARVSVRDRFVGTTPFGGPVTLGAGPALVEIVAPGYTTYRREHQLKPGGDIVVDVQLTPSEAGKPAPLPPPGKEQGGPGLATRWWFWAGVGVVAVAAGVATYVALTTERPSSRGEFGGSGPISTPLITF